MRRESDVHSARVLALHFYVQCWCNQPKENKKTMKTKINNTHMHFDFTGTYLTSDQNLTGLSSGWHPL